MAAYGDSDDEESLTRSGGHAEASNLRVGSYSHHEAWMANLGRGDNNKWLLGPRDPNEWFTGLKPTLCPGKSESYSLRDEVYTYHHPNAFHLAAIQERIPRVSLDRSLYPSWMR